MSVSATTSPAQAADALFAAVDAEDFDAMRALMAADPQSVDELSGGWRRGREQLDQYIAGLKELNISDCHSTRSDERVDEWGDAALVTFMLDQTYRMGGERQTVHAPTSLVLRREDGVWRVALVHSVPVAQEG
jgi:uncharacterized protein (TIGR02246 family)